MMANCVMAAVHSRWAFFQSLLTRRKTRYSRLIAASLAGVSVIGTELGLALDFLVPMDTNKGATNTPTVISEL